MFCSRIRRLKLCEFCLGRTFRDGGLTLFGGFWWRDRQTPMQEGAGFPVIGVERAKVKEDLHVRLSVERY